MRISDWSSDVCSSDLFRLELLDELDRDHLVLRGRIGKRCLRLGARRIERVRAGRLAGELVGGGDILADQILQLLLRCRLIGLGREFPRLLRGLRSEAHTSELHSLMSNSYAFFC